MSVHGGREPSSVGGKGQAQLQGWRVHDLMLGFAWKERIRSSAEKTSEYPSNVVSLIFIGLVFVLIAVSTAVFFPVRPLLIAIRFDASF